jgi:hypothetical protein
MCNLGNQSWRTEGATHIPPLLQKWGVVHEPKSLWDLKTEISSFHFNDFIVVKVISL